MLNKWWWWSWVSGSGSIVGHCHSDCDCPLTHHRTHDPLNLSHWNSLSPICSIGLELFQQCRDHIVLPAVVVHEQSNGVDVLLISALLLDYAHDIPARYHSGLHRRPNHRCCRSTASTTNVCNIPSRSAKHHCIRTRPCHKQVAEVLKARGADGCSLLTAAAEGGNEAIFADVPVLMGGKVRGRGLVAVITVIQDAAMTQGLLLGQKQMQQQQQQKKNTPRPTGIARAERGETGETGGWKRSDLFL